MDKFLQIDGLSACLLHTLDGVGRLGFGNGLLRLLRLCACHVVCVFCTHHQVGGFRIDVAPVVGVHQFFQLFLYFVKLRQLLRGQRRHQRLRISLPCRVKQLCTGQHYFGVLVGVVLHFCRKVLRLYQRLGNRLFVGFVLGNLRLHAVVFVHKLVDALALRLQHHIVAFRLAF